MSAEDVARIAEKLSEGLGLESGLAGTLKIDFGEDGCIFVDGYAVPNTVTLMDAPAECTVAISLEDFKRMVSGTLDPAQAFMQGRLKVEGDMGLAAKLGPALREARARRKE